MALKEVKNSWREFQESDPGSRFEEYYRRRQESGYSWFSPRRLFSVVVGLLLVVVSTFFGWAPGPGMLTFVIGLGMIAGEFRFAARFLDQSEVWLRKFWKFVTEVWHSSILGKAAILVCTLSLVATFGYTVYRLFFGG